MTSLTSSLAVDIASDKDLTTKLLGAAGLPVPKQESVRSDDGAITRVRIAPQGGRAANPAFDVTPARLVTGLITESGVAEASPEGLKALFPERS